MKHDAFYLSRLFDFYGGLLTDKQRLFFDLYYNQDLSLGEIAEDAGISRQSVHDLLARTEEKLRGLEAQLGCAARFQAVEAAMDRIRATAKQLEQIPAAAPLANEIRRAVDSIAD